MIVKKPSFWAGVIGFILILGNIPNLAANIYNPTDLFMVNVAICIGSILWIGFGLFLVAIFLRGKYKDDASQASLKVEPNSPGDIEILARRRNWTLGFVLLLELLGSLEVWILNNYTAGLTLINIGVIFDVLVNIFFFYIAVELFRGKRKVLNALFYIVIIYGLVWAIIDGLRIHLYGAFIGIIMAIYFVYAIKAPLNRKNHRIAHLILLPIFLILASITGYFD